MFWNKEPTVRVPILTKELIYQLQEELQLKKNTEINTSLQFSNQLEAKNKDIENLKEAKDRLEKTANDLLKLLKDNILDTFSYDIRYHPKVEMYCLHMTRHYFDSYNSVKSNGGVELRTQWIDLNTVYFKTTEAAVKYADDIIKKLKDTTTIARKGDK